MRIKSVVLKNFKRFTDLKVDGIPSSAKLVVLVGSNGSGKTSFFEAFNHFYKFLGFKDPGDFKYLLKTESDINIDRNDWWTKTSKLVDIYFYDKEFPNKAGESNIKKHFYFRSAYRNEPDFTIKAMNQQYDPTNKIRLETLIQNDQTVSENYQRLVCKTIEGVYDVSNNSKTIIELREELTGRVKKSLSNLFDDLNLSTLGEPLNNGSFYFSKGIINKFHYRNLSAGEKAAFDLILDMVIQADYYPDAIYCIDEPEAHMHTKLQGKVLRELYNLIPNQSQLWVATHSIGMLQEAKKIEEINQGTVVFLDFDNKDFDTNEVIYPSIINNAVFKKFYEIALGDFANLVLPSRIVFCEGDPNGKSRKDFDKSILEIIFNKSYADTCFISAGNCNDLINLNASLGEVMNKILVNTKIIKLIDLDDRTPREVEDLKKQGITVLSLRNIESYLLDDEILEKLCRVKNKEDKIEDCMNAKQKAMKSSINSPRNNQYDDLKSASGEIYNSLKSILSLTQCGSTKEAFLIDTIAPLITPDTKIYKQLEKDIFKGISNKCD